jgi:hypothetical protein
MQVLERGQSFEGGWLRIEDGDEHLIHGGSPRYSI